ncbi:MAG: hypothetical protein DBX51_04065 [Clostridiales bacterium]|nr:hypothetical protein [Clostridiales bacterium]PWM41335.1 MAG: hypothetical protein DBX51_04065 [Clostridiales bacterium]
MLEKEKKRLRGQLAQQAARLTELEDGKLAESLLASCGALARSAASLDCSSLPEHERLLVLAGALGLAEQAGQLLRSLGGPGAERRAAALDGLRSEAEEARRQEEELRREHDRLAGELRAAQEKIAALPEENARLLESFREKETLLHDLQNARETCSEEKQSELQKEIDALVPEVERLKDASDVLSNRLESLRAQQLRYSRECEALAPELLEAAREAAGTFGSALDSHEAALREVKRQADTLTERYEACRRLREEYADWFDADRTPLEALLAALPEAESERLRETLDVGELPSVYALLEQLRQGLEQLDGILKECAAAARLDQGRTLRRAHEMGGG